MNDLNGFDEVLLRLFDSAGYQLLAMLVALGVGAAHAIAPGHGKAITAAYMIGSHARYRDAAVLGAVVAGMHTISALVLAVAWVSIDALSGETELVTTWLQLIAGVVVVGVGIHLVRHRSHAHSHSHGHSPGHGHGHLPVPTHEHQRTPDHDHRPDHALSPSTATVMAADEEAPANPGAAAAQTASAESPWSRRGLAALGLSGGLLPSPSAFLVLVSGLLTGRVVFALVLVTLFGVGMALTLTTVGAATVRGQALLAGGSARAALLDTLGRWIPRAAAYAVLALGLIYAGTALASLTT